MSILTNYDSGPHSRRRSLNALGVGSFPVEWHLACDMKTIKSVYGLKTGANSVQSCINCDQERVKGKVVTREENLHHAAKYAYHRHTQRDGGKNKKSPLVQTFQHWYRIIAHRFRNKEDESEFDRLNGEAAIAARRMASLNSVAAANTALWHVKCKRVGSRYVPNPVGSEDQAFELEAE